MPLLIIVVLHIFICGIHELLYAHNTTFFKKFMDLFRSAILVSGRSTLNIKLLPLLVSILYWQIVIVWLFLLFSFAIIT